MFVNDSKNYAVLAEGITKIYSGKIVALNNVNITVEEGSIHAVLGPNGAGKTTLMRILTTQLRPNSGRAFILGHDVLHESDKVRQLIGYVPQEFSVWIDITGYENLYIYSKILGVPSDKRESIIKEVLEYMELSEVANRMVRTYSGGMIRRLEIATALMVRPKVLFLDEPTIGLDPRARELVWSRILQYQRENGVTVIFNTHYMDEAERYAKELTMLNLGRVVARGSPSDLIKEIGGYDLVYLKINPANISKAISVLVNNGYTLLSPNDPSNNDVILSLRDSSMSIPQIIKVLVENNVEIIELNTKKPTLNEVFIKLAGMTVEQAESIRGVREVASIRKAIRKGG